jgi:hypothetical protein
LPTYTRLPRFIKDFAALSPDEKAAFKDAIAKFVADLASDGPFRASLRVKGVQGAPGVFEMTWANDGRATFEYGPPIQGHEQETHVIWRRVGTHEIFGSP